MKHANYYKIEAKNNYELGLMLGTQFKGNLIKRLDKVVSGNRWGKKMDISKKYLEITTRYFPQYIEELKGYAKGAEVSFEEFWAMSLEDEADYYKEEKCTFIATNNGKLLSHNEDWGADAKDAICLLKKKINDLTIFELYYYNTLGGCSVSINSHGFVQSINTLNHSDWQLGIPRNIIARFISETSNPEKDFEKLSAIKRSLGYNHNIVSKEGLIWDIECTSKNQFLIKPTSPYFHTNHYIYSSKELDLGDDSTGTKIRYKEALLKVTPHMNLEELILLNGDSSKGKVDSIFNERTIGKMIIDFDNMIAKVWLLREEEKGWLDYELDFIQD